MKNNIRRQVELVLTRTGKYAGIPKGLNFLENVADTQLGGTEEYEQYKPDFFDDLGVTRTAMTDYSGNALAFNPNLPFQDWSRLNPKDMFSALSPMAKIPIEMTLNKDIFFGSPIVNEQKGGKQQAPKYMNFLKILPDSVLKQVGASIGEDGKLYISDRTAYAIRQIPMLYSLSRMTPASEQVKTPTQILSILGGIKFFPVEEEKFKENKAEQRYQELSNYITGMKTQGTVVPDMPDLETSLRAIYDNYARQQTDYDKIEQLKEIIKLQGGSSKEIDLFIKLKSQPYNELSDKAKGLNVSELAALLKQVGIEPTYEDIITALNEYKAGK
jgi:hypothetical protein